METMEKCHISNRGMMVFYVNIPFSRICSGPAPQSKFLPLDNADKPLHHCANRITVGNAE